MEKTIKYSPVLMMTIRSFILLMFIGVFLVLVNSCSEDDDGKIDDQNGTTFKDTRDGTVYKTVTIGSQVWMAENLKYLPSVRGPSLGSETAPYYYVYGYVGINVADAKATANYSTYGVLYNWDAAIAACPAGWHLPSNEEWGQLRDYLGGWNVAGGKLKETGTTHWQSPNTEATNESGFTGLPGGSSIPLGSGSADGAFRDIGFSGSWRSADESNVSSASHWTLITNESTMIMEHNYSKGWGTSVRCIKD